MQPYEVVEGLVPAFPADYSSLISDPYLQNDIDKLNRVQRPAARFITGVYTSRSEECVAEMLEGLEQQSLQERSRNNPLTILYKVVNGLVPAISADEYIVSTKSKMQTKQTVKSDFQMVKQFRLIHSE